MLCGSSDCELHRARGTDCADITGPPNQDASSTFVTLKSRQGKADDFRERRAVLRGTLIPMEKASGRIQARKAGFESQVKLRLRR
jgi:hypothetical protein